jgi:hypothetical protein
VKSSTFTANYVDYAKSTSPFFFGNWADELATVRPTTART